MSLMPAHKLSLAIRFQTKDWTEAVFKVFMDIPLQNFTIEDAALLGQPIMMLIMTTQAAIRNHRLLVAYNPLKLQYHGTTCRKSMTTCQCNWENTWWDRLAWHYLHPDFPCSPQAILLKLEQTPVLGVTTECWMQAVKTIKEQRIFEVEDDLKA
ncbi:hypothetical protein JB92DRAFT_2841981 [Gautieria morchelliformis]|nr:hypothetical protein JB92DRAFT_2841981 [Gautieria morchelliformis]